MTVVQLATSPGPDEDGAVFLPDTATATTIRDGDQYGGVRVTMHTRVAAADVKLQLDVSTGVPVTRAPQQITLPARRAGHPDVYLLGYPMATVLAEKLCTAVDLGTGNSRVRDYADLWTLTSNHTLDVDDVTRLADALTATARHRGVTLRLLSEAVHRSTGPEYAQTRQATYTAYRRRLGPDADHLPTDFATVMNDVIAFADPLLGTPPGTTKRWDAPTRKWH